MRLMKLSLAVLTILVLSACGADSPTAPASPQDAALAALRTATSPFQRIDAAVAAGYQAPVAAACVSSPAGVMGVHSVNVTYSQTSELVIEHPEILLYLPDSTAQAGFRLVGVEYSQTLLLRNTATGAVAPWFAPGPWPATHVVVNDVPEMFGQKFEAAHAGHGPGQPWHYDLHVWAWTENPSGMFAPFNPRLSCQN